MQDLYIRKGGDGVFNLVPLVLVRDDLLSLRQHLKDNGNAYAHRGSGFFWGETQPEDIANDHYFIERALKLIDEGYEVIYSCWW
jgi:hypothetical protein